MFLGVKKAGCAVSERTPTGWIQTYSGRKFYPLDPRTRDICWEDIAHALSNICRFTGHCREFYSVAQHCVLASEKVPLKVALWALLHDAPEAYICDMARPIKIQPEFTFYNQVEEKIMRIIAQAAGLEGDIPQAVKLIDKVLLKTEARDLGLLSPDWLDPEWGLSDITPLPETINPWPPAEAKRRFLDRFDLLYYLRGVKPL